MVLRRAGGVSLRCGSVVSAVAFAGIQAASAGEVPETARTQSLLVAGEFLEAADLVYQYPQLAGGVPSQLFASTRGSFFEAAPVIKAIGRSDAAALFLLSQPFSGVGVAADSHLLQLGFASHWGALRLGAAVRGSTDRWETGYGTDYTDPMDIDYEELRELAESYAEGALGVGVGNEATFADLVVESYRETFEVGALSRDSGDTLETRIDAVPRIRFRGALRCGFPGPEGTQVRVIGDFQSRSTKFELVEVRGLISSPTTLVKSYGHRWTAGLAVSGTSAEGTHARVHAFYRDRRGPDAFVGQISTPLPKQSVRRQDVFLGVSLERDIWYDLRLLAGLRSSFTVSESDMRRTRYDYSVERNSNVDETLGQQFAWGVQRRFERVDLTASMRTDLALSNLVLALDVAFLP
ncbi:MAG: hypothetical protein ACT4PE_05980 [Candidatus Eiseniibacteriota bacterium]